jgi:hypothetical protein
MHTCAHAAQQAAFAIDSLQVTILRELSADGAGFASKMSAAHVFVFANGTHDS